MTVAEYNEPLASGIIGILKDRGIKQTYLAEKIGLTDQELSDSLNGRRIIKAREIPQIAFALDLTPNDLYEMGSRAVRNSNRENASNE